MKTGTALIISSILLSIVLIFCTYQITSKIYAPPLFPSSLSVTTHEESGSLTDSSDEFISLYEASAYLRVDEAKLKSLIWSGKLDGTFTSYKSDSGGIGYIFSSEKLAEAMKVMIDKGEKLD